MTAHPPAPLDDDAPPAPRVLPRPQPEPWSWSAGLASFAAGVVSGLLLWAGGWVFARAWRKAG